MSAERPSAEQAFLARPMRWVTAILLRRPWITLALAGAFTLGCIFLTFTRLGYKTNRLDLLDPNSAYNRLWLEFVEEFGNEDDAVVVIEGRDKRQVIEAIDYLAEQIRHEPQLFHSVLEAVDLKPFRAKGLYQVPLQELKKIELFVGQSQPIIEGDWLQLKISSMLRALAHQHAAVSANDQLATATAQQLEHYLASLRRFLRDSNYQSPWGGLEPRQSFAALESFDKQYLLANDGRLGFILLRLNRDESEFSHSTEAIDALRHLLRQAQPELKSLHVTAGLTGLPVMENDEMRDSQSSMAWASSISLVAVAFIFIAGFGGMRHALLANFILLVGMAWGFGWATFAVGHLNILSVSFAVTLIGIGIDYGVYYIARYMKVNEVSHSSREALLETTYTVGPAIATGAITTAIAFFTAGLTSFAGVAELGIIAGGGILLCAIAQLFVLPALVLVVDRSRLGARRPHPLPVHRWIAPLLRVPRLVLACGICITALLATGIPKLWYDHNLLNMQAKGLESVELERKLLDECDQNVWYAVSVADTPEQLLERKHRFEELGSVERTEEIVSLLPPDRELRQPRIARLYHQLRLPTAPSEIPVDSLQELHTAFMQAHAVLQQIGATHLLASIEQLGTQLGEMNEAQCMQLFARFQAMTANDLLARLRALKSVAAPEPPSRSDLPPALAQRFIGKTGKHLLKIYGRGDLWNMELLTTFVHEVRTVDRRVTGNPLQAYEATLEMKGSYEEAALYATLIIAIVLLFDFRSVRYALLAALPLAIGFIQTFGILGLLGVPLNPANMIALPLILGIGVDYGVHIVHEFLEQSGPYRLSEATAIAVLVDALTTIVGFGSMMIASHQGLASLGRVLTLGIACCTVTSMIMLPALMAWMTRHRKQPIKSPPEEHRRHAAPQQLVASVD